MRTAVLDLGGSALTFVAAAPTPGGWFQELQRESVVLRLGSSIERHGAVPGGQVELAVETVRRLRAAAIRCGFDRLVAYGRSELSRADNAGELLGAIAVGAEVSVHTLTEDEELRLLDRAVAGTLGIPQGRRAVVDLDDDAIRIVEGEMGRVVRPGLRDDEPPSVLANEGWLADELVPVGPVAGSLFRAALSRRPGATSATMAVEGARLSHPEFAAACAELQTMSATDVLLLDYVEPPQADRLVIAARVVAGLLERLPTICVSHTDADLGTGIVLDAMDLAVRPSTSCDVRAAAVLDLRHRNRGPSRHADHVADLATHLFDELVPLHRLSSLDRELLAHAARLHDLAAQGDRSAGSHRSGAELILGSTLRGFTPDDTALVAAVVRFQRGRPPGGHFPPFRGMPASVRRRCQWLTSLLRVAHGLDVGRDGGVSLGRMQIADGLVVVEVHGDDEMARFGVNGEREMLERLSGRRLLVRAGGSSPVFDHIRVRPAIDAWQDVHRMVP